MNNVPTIKNIDVSEKKVLVIGAFDVHDSDNPRANSIRDIVQYLKDKNASKIKVIGHCETEYDLASQLKTEFPEVEFDSGVRKDPREKENSMEYAIQLAGDFDIYINEDFATSHRKYTSIVALPQQFKSKSKNSVMIGPRFEKELEMLNQVWDKPGKRVLVIGGAKIDDKQKFAEKMADKFEFVLKGGLLPGVELREDGLDISDRAIEEYVIKISKADVILAAGVMGKYEDSLSSSTSLREKDPGKGTRTILKAIADNSHAYKVAGGGDIEMAISTYKLTDRFDWISVGGGAMLEYLSKGTLPGIEAIK